MDINNIGGDNSQQHTPSSDIFNNLTNYELNDVDYLRKISQQLQVLISQNDPNSRNASSGHQMQKNKSTSQGNDPEAASQRRSGAANILTNSPLGGFTDEIENGLMDSILGSDFRDRLQGSMQQFANLMGGEVEDIPGMLGRELGNQLGGILQNNPIFNQITGGISNTASHLFDVAGTAFNEGVNDYLMVAGEAATGSGAALAGLEQAALSLGPELLALGPALLGVVALDMFLGKVQEEFARVAESAKKLGESMSESANFYQSMMETMLKNEMERREKDEQALVEAEFGIIKDASNKVMDVWDNVMAYINQTQGYTKAQLQDLMSSYAARLDQAGLTKVVNAADISSNLEKVLQTGLSGEIAEEFAYIATILEQAVPTQDWFSFAADYSAIAANALKEGMAQSDAIDYANMQLQQFASNVLFASRQIAGGFSTGLSNASDLFEEAVKITTAAKSGTVASVSGVLTSVSALVGAIAPDLASGLVSSVVNAAVGGNASNIVALRSLAGINASNTEFLMALANDPQSLFASLFTNLARLQNMSPTNFMEVAEGLADIFDISSEAFARVDFSYLADAVSSMNVNNSALSENMKLLASGQSTLTEAQLRNQQINEYIATEGLAYVLDNEVARAVQEHMWEEQLANEIKEHMFAVELEGDAKDFLETLVSSVSNIIDFLNPFSWFSKLGNIILTGMEASAQKLDMAQILELGKVGQGNAIAFHDLTTLGKDLNLTKSYISLLGGHSLAGDLRSARSAMSMGSLGAQTSALMTGGGMNNGFAMLGRMLGQSMAELNSLENSRKSFDRRTGYSWNTVSKTAASLISSSAAMSAATELAATSASAAQSATEAAAKQSNSKFERMINDIEKYVDDKKSYDDWKSDMRKYGISDFDQALANANMSEADLQSRFQQEQAKEASEYEYKRDEKEDEFWDSGKRYWDEFMPAYATKVFEYDDTLISNQATQIENELKMIENQVSLISLVTTGVATLVSLTRKHAEFYDAWVDYYVNHTAYSKSTLSASEAAAIQNAEKSEYGDAILALAHALTSNQVDLVDPTVQQNALLSKMLIVLEGIMQNTTGLGTKTSSGSLSKTIQGLSLGI